MKNARYKLLFQFYLYIFVTDHWYKNFANDQIALQFLGIIFPFTGYYQGNILSDSNSSTQPTNAKQLATMEMCMPIWLHTKLTVYICACSLYTISHYTVNGCLAEVTMFEILLLVFSTHKQKYVNSVPKSQQLHMLTDAVCIN